MGAKYAGILGPLGFAAAILRGGLQGGGVEPTLLTAWLALWAFAAVGYVTGRLAAWIVEESVTARLAAELEARQAIRPAAETKT